MAETGEKMSSFRKINGLSSIQATADAKVPSVIYYDKLGKAQAHGAETDDDEVVYNAESEGWNKASWYVLILSTLILAHSPQGGSFVSGPTISPSLTILVYRLCHLPRPWKRFSLTSSSMSRSSFRLTLGLSTVTEPTYGKLCTQ
jgi:hypothetical protein